MPFPFAAASLVLGGLGLIQSQRAASASRKANRLQQRIADVKAQRERVRLVAEARRRRATLANQAELTGVSGSSGAIGGQQGVTQQAASGISFLDQVSSSGQQANIFAQRAADRRSVGNIFATGSSLLSTYSALKEN